MYEHRPIWWMFPTIGYCADTIKLVVVCHSCKLQWSSCDFVILRCIIMDSGGSLDSSSI